MITAFIAASLAFSTSCKNSNKATDVQDSTLIPQIEVKKKFGIPIDDYQITEDKVQANEPFSLVMKKHGIDYPIIHKSVEASKEVFDVRRINEGKKYFVFKRLDSTASMDYFIYQMSKTEYLKFDYRDSIEVSIHQLAIETDTIKAGGIIESSLWMTMKNAGIDPMLALDLSDIYAWTIDFYGLQKGDSFNVVYERKFIDTTYIGIGRILTCHFIHTEHNYQAYLFTQDSIENYFDEEGGSLRRAFLKAPLKYGRVSSRFSNSRLHPVLKIRRPHHGVDYAAPRGTPVYTIGDGKVTFVGRKGGYGKRVEIKHNGTYKTGYAHLSRYAKGLKVGDFVKQGTLIGYVGSTGMSTGPHLDFRVYKNGSPIDPLKMKSPPAIPVKEENKEAFKEKMEYYEGLLRQ